MLGPYGGLLASALLLWLTSCAGSEALIRPEPQDQAPWHIQDPIAFNLNISQDLFRGRLAAAPTIDRCHTQGLEITEDRILISCTLYDPRFKTRQVVDAESIVLSAPLSVMTRQESTSPSAWQIATLTESVPKLENPRLVRDILSTLPNPLPWLVQWFLSPESQQYTMGHPSGIHYDSQSRRLWVSNSVYAPKSYSRLHQLNPHTLEKTTSPPPLEFRDHLGLILALPNHLLLSVAWGDPTHFRLIDQRQHKSRMLDVRSDDLAHYQDCDLWDEKTVFCVGQSIRQHGWTRQIGGRLHVMTIQGNSFDNLQLEYQGAVAWHHTDRLDAFELGQRRFYHVEGIGNIERGPLNQYGPLKSAMPLTHEGFAISPDRRHVYFLPEDLPAGKLIRMKLQKTTP